MKSLSFNVYNRPIALELSQNGNYIMKIIKNKKDYTKDVYIFEDNEKVRIDFDRVLRNRGFVK